MEVNAPIVYDTTSAREFINNLSSKNKKIEAGHLSYNKQTYTDETQKLSAVEEADKYIRSVTSKKNTYIKNTDGSVDPYTKYRASASYNQGATSVQNGTGSITDNSKNVLPQSADDLKAHKNALGSQQQYTSAIASGKATSDIANLQALATGLKSTLDSLTTDKLDDTSKAALQKLVDEGQNLLDESIKKNSKSINSLYSEEISNLIQTAQQVISSENYKDDLGYLRAAINTFVKDSSTGSATSNSKEKTILEANIAELNTIIESIQKGISEDPALTNLEKELQDIVSELKENFSISRSGEINQAAKDKIKEFYQAIKSFNQNSETKSDKLNDEFFKKLENLKTKALATRTTAKYTSDLDDLADEILKYSKNPSKDAVVKAEAATFLLSAGNGVLKGYVPYGGAKQGDLQKLGLIKKAVGKLEEGEKSLDEKPLPTKNGPGKKFLQEVDSLYKTNLTNVIYENAFLKSGLERSLTMYWNIKDLTGKDGAEEDLLLGKKEKAPPILMGIDSIKQDYVDKLNSHSGDSYYLYSDSMSALTFNYNSFTSSYKHELNLMPVPVIDLTVDRNGKIAFKNHFPNAFMPTSTSSAYSSGGESRGIQTTADMLGYNSVLEFLLAGAPFTDDAATQGNILSHQYASPANTDKDFDKRQKYFNKAIKLLAESMPDFMPNMFDVLLTVGNEKPISIFSDDKALRTQLLYNSSYIVPIQTRKNASPVSFKTGQEDIDVDSRDYKDRIVNARTLAMRCTGITLPGIESSTYDFQWLNHTISKVGSRSNRHYTSSMTIRLDMPLFFADAFLELAGQYSTVNFQDPVKMNYYLNHYYFHNKNKTPVLSSDGKSFDIQDNDTRINLYVPLFDFNNVKNNPNAKYGALNVAKDITSQAGGDASVVGTVGGFVTGGKKMPFNAYGFPNDYLRGEKWAHDTRITSTPVYCFEDVNFLGVDNLSFTTSGGTSPMTTTVEFTFRRFYKFLWDMNAQW